MQEYILISISIILIILGIIGSVLPVLPSTPLAWIGLLVYSFSAHSNIGTATLVITAIIVMISLILDYIIPSIGTKKMGGSKEGIIGASIGVVVGVFFLPFGIILGPFLGAFLGELYHNKEDKKQALKAAMGSFLGFLTTIGINIIICIAFLVLIISDLI